jgi:hypothetical protein
LGQALSRRSKCEALGGQIQAALHYEAAQFLNQASSAPEVRNFICQLPEDARHDYQTVLGGLDGDGVRGHGPWFSWNRNRTFHYSRLGRRQPIRRALARAAQEIGHVDWPRRFGDRRFGYADQVVLEWLPPVAEQEDRLSRMADTTMALARFSQAAVNSYLTARGVLPGAA